MFDIGWSELLVIGIVALVVIGPKELPGVLRTVGQMVGKLRRMAGEFQGQFQEALREAELDGLKKSFTDFTEDANKSIAGALPSNPLLDIENEVKAATASIEGRKDEPATKVEDATALATGIDPATAAVEAQLPKPEEPAAAGALCVRGYRIGGAEARAAAGRRDHAGRSQAARSKPDDVKPAAVEPDAAAARAAIEGAPADLFADDLPRGSACQAQAQAARGDGAGRAGGERGGCGAGRHRGHGGEAEAQAAGASQDVDCRDINRHDTDCRR